MARQHPTAPADGWLRPGLGLSLCALGLAACDTSGRPPALVPLPRSVETARGSVELSAEWRIRVSPADDPELTRLARLLSREIALRTGVDLAVQDAAGPRTDTGTPGPDRQTDASPSIRLVRAGAGDDPDVPFDRDESYALVVDGTGVEVRAPRPAGVFYGTRTLLQLLPPDPAAGGRGVALPFVRISDAPRFPYRGMHLDVGRHWFPVDFVKRYIDLLALYKFNAFHWHLTEDQGWRLEIEGYPRLTEVGAWRRETILERNFDPYAGDGTPHGGFYTRDEVREIVAYAAERYVTVIPEIEMPGHSLAALAAYPELACTEGPFEVATVWGVHEEIYCPKEETFVFLEDVLSEVMELFPSPWIHIGGDEAPKTRWIESPLAQEVIRREGLADEAELQSWFLRRIESFVSAHGRRIVGWDEILEGGLPPDAIVMSWRGVGGGVEAAKQGHDVIMTPTSHAYFDYYQGDPLREPLAIGGYLPLERVYAFEPLPPELGPGEARHVLGAQGNVWTEYLKEPRSVEYMAFPRAMAMAEVVWSPRGSRDWEGFLARLGPRLAELDALGVAYRVPDVGGLEGDVMTLDDRVRLALTSPVADGEVRYTLDGSEPSEGSPLYEKPLDLRVDESGTVVTARLFLPGGRGGASRSARLVRGVPAPAEPVPPGVEPGISWALFEGDFASVRDLEGRSPVAAGGLAAVALPESAPPERFGLVLEGWLRVPRTGVYRFLLTSDDGSDLRIGNATVVDHDGLHAAEVRGGAVALERGAHRLRVRMFQAGGGRALALDVVPPGEEEAIPVPADWLRRDPGRPGPAGMNSTNPRPGGLP